MAFRHTLALHYCRPYFSLRQGSPVVEWALMKLPRTRIRRKLDKITSPRASSIPLAAATSDARKFTAVHHHPVFVSRHDYQVDASFLSRFILLFRYFNSRRTTRRLRSCARTGRLFIHFSLYPRILPQRTIQLHALGNIFVNVLGRDGQQSAPTRGRVIDNNKKSLVRVHFCLLTEAF